MAVDPYSTRTLIKVVNKLADSEDMPEMVLRDKFFPDYDFAYSEYVDIDKVDEKRHMAGFMARDAEKKPILVEKSGFKMQSVKIPYISEMASVSASEAAKFRERGENIYDKTSLNNRAAKMLNRMLKKLLKRLDLREEWMAAKLIQTGKFEIKGVGVDALIDFKMDSSHTPDISGGIEAWSDTVNSDPLAKLRELDRLIMADSGTGATAIFMGYKAEDAFLNHPKVQSFLDNRRINQGELYFEPKGTGRRSRSFAKVGNYRGMDIYVYYGRYYDRETSQEYYFIEPENVVLGSEDGETMRIYGEIVDLKAPGGKVNDLRYFSKSWEEEKPSRRNISIDSAPILCMYRPEAFVCAKVVS